MNIDEIVDKIKFAIELCGDGGPSPFSTEELNEMYEFLNAQKYQEHGVTKYKRGKNPRWKVGDKLAYYECTSDCEGEANYGEVVAIELDENIDDWIYQFDDGYWELEKCMLDNETYRIK